MNTRCCRFIGCFYNCFTLQDDDDEALEHKVTELERQITEDPFNYDKHIELIQALW